MASETIAQKRYATVQGEYTALFVVGESEETNELILCLPWQDSHSEKWHKFLANNLRGETRPVRFTLVEEKFKRSLRKKAAESKTPVEFGENDAFRVDVLAQAYMGHGLERSVVLETEPGDPAMDVEADGGTPMFPAGGTATPVAPPPRQAASNPFAIPPAVSSSGEASNAPRSRPEKSGPSFSDLSSVEGADERVPGYVEVIAREIADLKAQRRQLENNFQAQQQAMTDGFQTLQAQMLEVVEAVKSMRTVTTNLDQKQQALQSEVVSAKQAYHQSLSSSEPFQEPSSEKSSKTEILMDRFIDAMKSQTEAITKAIQGSSHDDITSGDGLALSLIGTAEHQRMGQRLETAGNELAKEHMLLCRQEIGCEDGMPMTMQYYGDKTLAKHWERHRVLQRFWIMESAVHYHLWAGRPERALAQVVQNLKALSKSTRQGGQWKGAWEHTHLADPFDPGSGVPMAEDMAMGKYLREKAAIEKILAEAKKD